MQLKLYVPNVNFKPISIAIDSKSTLKILKNKIEEITQIPYSINDIHFQILRNKIGRLIPLPNEENDKILEELGIVEGNEITISPIFNNGLKKIFRFLNF